MGTIIGCGVTLTGGVDTESRRTVSKHDSRDTERVERIGGTCGTRYEILSCTDHCLVTRETLHTCTDHKMSLVLE